PNGHSIEAYGIVRASQWHHATRQGRMPESSTQSRCRIRLRKSRRGLFEGSLPRLVFGRPCALRCPLSRDGAETRRPTRYEIALAFLPLSPVPLRLFDTPRDRPSRSLPPGAWPPHSRRRTPPRAGLAGTTI